MTKLYSPHTEIINCDFFTSCMALTCIDTLHNVTLIGDKRLVYTYINFDKEFIKLIKHKLLLSSENT